MRKILFSIAVVLMLLLVGCGGESTSTTIKTEPAQTVVKDTPAEPEKTVVKTAPVKEIEDDLSDLIEKGKKINSYEFTYAGPPDRKMSYRVYVNGNRWKMDFGRNQIVIGPKMFDTVYLDTAQKTAIAWCEKEKCDNNVKGIAHDLDYDDYKITSPIEKLNEITYAEITPEVQRIDNRDTVVCTYETASGEEGKVWLDDYYGVPMKVEIEKPESAVIDYGDTAFNAVTLDEVTHQD